MGHKESNEVPDSSRVNLSRKSKNVVMINVGNVFNQDEDKRTDKSGEGEGRRSVF